jgi:drug/metabolite transporter (DMT)-like permease
MAQVSQVRLVQPVLGILWAALILHEHLSQAAVLGGLLVVACTRFAVRARLKGTSC